MFARWGALIYRYRRIVVVLSLVVAVASLTLATKAAGELGSGGWLDKSSESAHVADQLAADFGTGQSALIVLFRGPAGTDAGSPAYQAQVAAALTDLKQDDRVAGIVGYAETGAARFVSQDKTMTYVVAELKGTDEESVGQLDSLRAEIVPPPGTTIQLTGYAPLTKDSATQSEKDLERAEIVSLPLALIILVAVFGSIVAAAMPLLVAGLAIPAALAMVYIVAQHVEMSVFVLNIATMLGLALAIDYSLFLVYRFREELQHGRPVGLAVERAVATSGKAVAFSGTAVAIGLAGLLFLKSAALGSIGLGGALVVFSSVVFALTFLPALLGMLGPRVNALSVGSLWRRLRRQPALDPLGPPPPPHESAWGRVAHAVMRRPIAVLVPLVALLIWVGTPALDIEQGIPGASIYPVGLESRDAYVALQQQFPPGETSPITVLATVQGDPLSPSNVQALTAYATRLAAEPDVARVESPFSGLTDPRSGQPLNAQQIAALYAAPASQRPPALAGLTGAYIRGSVVRFDAISPLDPSLPEATGIIPAIRAIDAGPGITTQVGGAAALGYDFLAAMSDRLPWVVGVVLVAMLVILFLLFGSVVLPVKAVIMTLLSITASFGALVWIFQDGNLSHLLDFQPLGYTVAGNPIIIFCILFGLSMDYEVLLLSRIQEAWRRSGDNTEAVAEGVTRTAGVITGAALIMVSVFAAFALAQIITIKSLGVAMAIAVAVDATIIRVFVVPATMRLLGRWNWWAPGPLGRLAERLGFGHLEGEGEGESEGDGDGDGEAPTLEPSGAIPAAGS